MKTLKNSCAPWTYPIWEPLAQTTGRGQESMQVTAQRKVHGFCFFLKYVLLFVSVSLCATASTDVAIITS